MGGEDQRSLDRLRGGGTAEDEGARRSRGLQAHARAARRMAEGGGAAASELDRGSEEGRWRSRGDRCRPAGRPEEARSRVAVMRSTRRARAWGWGRQQVGDWVDT